MPATDIQERIGVLGLDNDDRKCPLYIYSDSYANMQGLPRANLTSELWRGKMKAFLLANHIKFWIIDNLGSVTGGLDENKKQDWDPVNQWLLELRFAGIATMLLHHVGKEGAQRGTSAREDNIDISVILKTPTNYVEEDGCRFVAHFTKHRVPLKGLPLIADREFKLTYEQDEYIWADANVKKETKRAVLEMLSEKMNTEAIKSSLKISKGRISQIKTQLINDGLLAKNGELTQSGFKYKEDF